ncbi:hypothetical protein AB670_03746 [Chryseobacterium sp. MOF25P]|nr:hypothetical protein AB670_03746 [Chryseobacterium sp. MOF25P]OBW43644.1 hypothetical protein AB671_04285 [Chryseobacterium sp. BGARF1]
MDFTTFLRLIANTFRNSLKYKTRKCRIFIEIMLITKKYFKIIGDKNLYLIKINTIFYALHLHEN